MISLATIAIASRVTKLELHNYIQVTVVTLYLHVVTTAEQVVLVITSICCIVMELMLPIHTFATRAHLV